MNLDEKLNVEIKRFKHTANEDKIKRMSTTELAAFLNDFAINPCKHCLCPTRDDQCVATLSKCVQYIEQWLRSDRND